MKIATFFLILPLIILHCVSCSTTATIKTTRGNVEAHLISSTENTVTFKAKKNGKTYTMTNNDINDIDHPGNVLMVYAVLGTTYFSYMGYMFTKVEKDFDNDLDLMSLPTAILSIITIKPLLLIAKYGSIFMAIGNSCLFIYGTSTYVDSRQKTSNFIFKDIAIMPEIISINDKTFYGASLSLRF